MSWRFLVTSLWRLAVTIAAPISVLAMSLTVNSADHNPDCPPLTRSFQIQSFNNGEALMWNTCSVFRLQVSVKGGVKWNLANLPCIHLGRVVTSRGTAYTPCLHYPNAGLLCCSLSMNLSHLRWFIGWPGSAPQSLQPPEALPFLSKSKEDKIREWCAHCFFF